jgi:hypothetical protein
MSTTLEDLFRPYGIPPTPLHEAVQDAARQAGWIPPWDREQQQRQKKSAGKRSGRSRGGLASIRRSIVTIARKRQASKYAPYANASVDALEEEYHALLGDGGGENCTTLAKGKNDLCLLVPRILARCSTADREKLKKASRETLLKDLKQVLKLQRESR